MKKKIGLITFHQAINYGVYLQAYALQKFIEISGYEPEIIDYNKFTEIKKKKKSIFYRIIHIKETLNALHLIIFLNNKNAKNKASKFASFANDNFVMSRPMDSFDDVAKIQNQYDKFICGSDQIWNPEYTQANPVYFLAFTPKEKRIAYAPSFGISEVNEHLAFYSEIYKEFIENFSAVSVREKTGKKIIEEIARKTVDVVVDPTFLLPVNYWESLITQTDKDEQKYVLFYILGNNKQYRKLAQMLSERYKYRVIVIPTNPLWNNLGNVEKIYAGIDEFLYLVKKSEYIITDSFHGMAFSVIFHKNFSAVLRNDTKYSLCSRIEDFLGTIGLQNNCVKIEDILNIDVNRKTEYIESDILLNEWIGKSKKFLLDAISYSDVKNE